MCQATIETTCKIQTQRRLQALKHLPKHEKEGYTMPLEASSHSSFGINLSIIEGKLWYRTKETTPRTSVATLSPNERRMRMDISLTELDITTQDCSTTEGRVSVSFSVNFMNRYRWCFWGSHHASQPIFVLEIPRKLSRILIQTPWVVSPNPCMKKPPIIINPTCRAAHP